jgi:hypothetical protein
MALRVPVIFRDLKRPVEDDPRRAGELVTTTSDFHERRVESCVLLTRGNAHIDIVKESVVICTGAVSINSVTKSIVIAGHHIESHACDFQDRPPPGASHSLLLSGSVILNKVCFGGICSGRRLVHIDVPRDAVVMNTERLESHLAQQVQQIHNASLPVVPMAQELVLPQDWELTQVVARDPIAKSFVILKSMGREHLYRVRTPLPASLASSDKRWAGCQFSFISEHMLIVSNADMHFSIRVVK